MSKLPKLPTIEIQGKPYVAVHERIRYFNETYPMGSIRTILSFPDENTVRAIAEILPDVTVRERLFTGSAEERRDDGYINKTSAVENAESSAVGRALGMMGIGIDASVASADEVVTALKKQGMVAEEKTSRTCADCGRTNHSKYATCYACSVKRRNSVKPVAEYEPETPPLPGAPF